MIFTPTKLKDAVTVGIEKMVDNRGFFARSYCQKDFAEQGLVSTFVQTNVSFNAKKGTLRGMHFQHSPYEECKLVRCVRGGILDVIIDLRKDSPTYKQWVGVELTAENYRSLYVPPGFAHGFMTLEDNTEVTYQVSQFYMPGSEGGVKFDDPTFGIAWPMTPTTISEKDANWAPYQE